MAVSRTFWVMLLLVGLTLGATGLALGTYLASGNNGWPSALWYSVVGLVGAPVSFLTWTSRRSRRRTMVAGLVLVVGLVASMGLLLDLTHEMSQISFAWSQVPLAVLAWMLIWLSWQLLALARVILFEPPRVRQRLSRRRGNSDI